MDPIVRGHRLDDKALKRLSADFEDLSAQEIIKWAFGESHFRAVTTSSFSDGVLAHLVTQENPSAKIVFIDTGFAFSETVQYVHRLHKVLGFNLEIIEPNVDLSQDVCGTEMCCQRRKVEPLISYLSGHEFWITGIRRTETSQRAEIPIVSWDTKYQVVKVNPIANWSDDDVAGYIDRFNLPVHPLVPLGYLSIGCAPVTSPVLDPDDPRSGRWPGSDKTECGLHV